MAETGPAPGGSEVSSSASPRVVRVLCVEDLHIVAQAICERVDSEPGLQSVGVLHGPEALPLAVQQLKPDIVLLDLYYGGRDAFAELRAVAGDVRIIVVSGDNHPDTIRRVFEAGARGYVVKGDPAEIIAAIRAVCAGGTWRPGDQAAQREAGGLDGIIDAMIAALGDPVAVEDRSWAWHIGRLRVEARTTPGELIIDLPWPLRSIQEPPSFGSLHEEGGAEGNEGGRGVKLRFAVASRAALDLVLGVIAYESREG